MSPIFQDRKKVSVMAMNQELWNVARSIEAAKNGDKIIHIAKTGGSNMKKRLNVVGVLLIFGMMLLPSLDTWK